MKYIILLLSFCIALALAAPAPPVVSETFSARIQFELQNNTHHLQGEGDEARDVAGNRAVIHAENHEGRDHWFIFQLARYDLGQFYEVNSVNLTDCRNSTITGSLPPHWAWLANATYSGNHNNINFWNTTLTFTGGLTVHVGAGFHVQTPNNPAFFEQNSFFNNNFERSFVNYINFQPKVDPAYFDVPKLCGGPGSALF